MAKVKVQITERLVRTVEVDASTETEAVEKAKQLYSNQDVVLEYDDFDGFTEFKSETIPDPRTEFHLKRDRKITVWERDNFWIKALTETEALEILKNDTDIDIDECETLWETAEDLPVSENDGQSTLEILNDKGKVLFSNAEVKKCRMI